MSDKKWYKLVFKQIQPIHIGFGSHGVVNETRIFIPGWTMWGALTKAYNLINGNELSQNQKLFENISCFYPNFDKEGNDENVLFPKFDKGNFYLGNYSEDNFRAKFVDTFILTAINPATNTALDESLHELNIILPSVKANYREDDKDEKQIYWVGIISLKEDVNIPNEIYIGGDARYGLGLMQFVDKKLLGEDLEGDWRKKGGYIPVGAIHELPDKKIELLVETIEPWKNAELKVKLRENGFYFVPGSCENDSFNCFYKGILKK